MSLLPNLKSIFKENLELAQTKKDPYGRGQCPVCGKFASGTYRHVGAPVFCENRHHWGGTCGHPDCKNDVIKEAVADPKLLGVIDDPNAELPQASNGDVVIVRSKYKPAYEILIWDFDPVYRKDGWIYSGEAKTKEEAVKHVQDNVLFEKRGGEAFGKTLQDIADHHKVNIKDLEKQLEKGIAIEGEHGDDKVHAKKVAMDHLWENPKYYTKLVSAGLEEPIEEEAPTAPAQVAPSTNAQPQQQPQQPQQDPKKVAEYQKKAAEFDKKIQMSITDQQKFTKQKNELDKKIQKLNLIQQKATKAKDDLAKKLGINTPA